MKDESGCSHITTRIRAVSVHQGMQVGARVSPTGDLWWCVGCGGLFADDLAKHPIAMPTSTVPDKRCSTGCPPSPSPTCPVCGVVRLRPGEVGDEDG